MQSIVYLIESVIFKVLKNIKILTSYFLLKIFKKIFSRAKAKTGIYSDCTIYRTFSQKYYAQFHI